MIFILQLGGIFFVGPKIIKRKSKTKLVANEINSCVLQISSRYDGVIKKLYYEAGDMATVGKPRDLASRSPASVSAVSPDWEITRTPGSWMVWVER